MGCDIHSAIEVYNGKRWQWLKPPLLAALGGVEVRPAWLFTERDYEAFTILAGVRHDIASITPLADPRGLPKDLSYELGEAHDEAMVLGDALRPRLERHQRAKQAAQRRLAPQVEPAAQSPGSRSAPAGQEPDRRRAASCSA